MLHDDNQRPTHDLIHFFDSRSTPYDDDQLLTRLGGKGAGLVAMSRAGLPVPPGFVLTTEACRSFLAGGWSDDHHRALNAGIASLEQSLGRRLGDPESPLLVSVRSGAAVSMPGMMDTVLNVGMSDQAEQALVQATGDADFARDTHRRALVSFATIVLAAPAEDLTDDQVGNLTPVALRQWLADEGYEIPSDPMRQLVAAAQSVFTSWNSERARHYRRIESIDDDLYTAVTVQAMVFGNLGQSSGTGVAFTRNPSTGEPGLMGDFLVGAQGEDVVAGTHRTQALAEMADRWPGPWAELQQVADVLEHHYRDMVDIEFTVERGKLWMLQARRAKRSPLAVFRSAVAMAEDGGFQLTRAEAVKRCLPYLDDPPHDMSTEQTVGGEDVIVIADGLAAAPGRAVGVLTVDVDEAVALEHDGVDVILARRETSPADVHGMAAAAGLITKFGGLVSHAAVVARSWGKPAVVGATELELTADGVVGREGAISVGTVVTVDGDNGRLLYGAHPLSGRLPDDVVTIKQWQAELAAPAAPSAQCPTTTDRGGEPEAAGGETTFTLLHALRIKGMATTAAVAALAAATPDEAGAELQPLMAAGLASHIEPRDLWRLTDEGRQRHAELLADQVADLDNSLLCYDQFLELNGQFKSICTDWQVRDGAPNDHSDATYDRAVVARLLEINDQARPLLASASQALGWLSGYQPRLDEALGRLQTGDNRAFTGVMCESFHDIWMELHEDLILVQGIDRSAEGSF